MILIDIPPGEAFYRAILSTAGVMPRVVHRTSSVEGLRAIVARGFGWSMLLQQDRTNLSYEGRVYRELDIADEVPDVALLAVTLRGRPTRRIVAFLDYCTELFAPSN
jgi:DNA-binding transcriptional LysR family regulator